MDYKLLADTALLAGEIMLRGGAETYRVEETICRILQTSGLEKTEGIALTTVIMVMLEGQGTEPITYVKRIGERSTNLGHVNDVNHVSRMFCSGKMSLDDAYKELTRISTSKQYSGFVMGLCTVLTASFFTILMGGAWNDCIVAALNGMLLVGVTHINNGLHINRFVLQLLTSFFIALLSIILVSIFGSTLNLEAIIAGSIMSMLPGVAITNAIRDLLQGDYMSAGARATEAFVIAVSIAVGIGLGLAFGSFLIGGAIL